MAKTITPDQFAAQIRGILAKYGDSVQMHVNEATREVSKKAAKAVKSAAKSTFGGNGKYAAGWTSRAETGRISAQGIVYNEVVPGLPHLLEHGHANRSGGRTPGRAHIKPVEEQVIKEFESEVKNGI